MEELILNSEEHKILIRYKDMLENKFSVKICVPELKSCNDNDIIFAHVNGCVESIYNVKEFLKAESGNDVLILSEDSTLAQNEVPVITLSDSDSEVSALPIVNQTNIQGRKKRKQIVFDIDLTKSPVCNDDSVCEVSSTTVEPAFKRRNMGITKTGNAIPSQSKMAQTVVQTSMPTVGTLFIAKKKRQSKAMRKNQRKKMRRLLLNNPVPAFIPPAPAFIPPAPAFIPPAPAFIPPAPAFLPLQFNSGDTIGNNLVQENSSIPVARPKIPIDPNFLRPVVIDGSNVAREHGKKDHTFSCKGIQLSIDYFLQRGHTQVTAFVPNFRRHSIYGSVPTTDEQILEDLATAGHVVFTPSRKVNGKRVTCYDDRFIVELACTNGGVILSNDNYKDLMEESETFKSTIESRLLMFCFVGDLLMIPHDPLGRTGPSLEEYLSFPSNEQ